MRLFKLVPVCAATIALAVSSSVLAQPPLDRDREAPDGRPPRSPVISVLDQDGDGEISAEEIKNAAKALETLDRDGNGKLTEEELRPRRRRGPGQGPTQDRRRRGRPNAGRGGPGGERGDFAERIMNNDKNGDGKVTKDEAPESMQRFFDRIDENGDGVIEKSEVDRMAERFQNYRPGERGPRGRGRGNRPQRPQRPPLESNDEAEGKENKEAKEAAENGSASRLRNRGPRGDGDPVLLTQNGLEPGMSLPNVTVYDEAGKAFQVASLKGHYTVVVFGCLT